VIFVELESYFLGVVAIFFGVVTVNNTENRIEIAGAKCVNPWGTLN
jgi:hypothetical protein